MSFNFEIIPIHKKNYQLSGIETTEGIIFENNVIRKEMSLVEVLMEEKILLLHLLENLVGSFTFVVKAFYF